MRKLVLKVAAGTEEPYAFGPHDYISLDSGATVSVTVKTIDGNEENTLDPGDDMTWDSPQKHVLISHDGAADTQFTLWWSLGGKRGSAKVSGNIQPIGGSDNAAAPPYVKFPAPQDVQFPTAQETKVQPTGVTQYRRSTASSAVNSIVTPAANVNGVTVSFSYVSLYPGNNGAVRLFMKNSTPASWQDGAPLNVTEAFNTGTATGLGQYGQINPQEYFVPAGYGLYEAANTAAVTSTVDVTYTVH